MTLKFTLKALPPLGFGYTFRCFLDHDSQKTAGQEAITLTVVVADKEVLNKLNAIPPGNVVTGRFSHLEDGVPYRHMPITGFVDDKMTSWKLEGID